MATDATTARQGGRQVTQQVSINVGGGTTQTVSSLPNLPDGQTVSQFLSGGSSSSSTSSTSSTSSNDSGGSSYSPPATVNNNQNLASFQETLSQAPVFSLPATATQAIPAAQPADIPAETPATNTWSATVNDAERVDTSWNEYDTSSGSRLGGV